MRADGFSVRGAPADRMKPPCKRDKTDRTARRGKRRQSAPFAGRDIVFQDLIDRVLMNRRGKTPGDIDFAVQRSNAGMRRASRHRREIAPATAFAGSNS